MRILLINSVCGVKSTGRICTDLAEVATEAGHTIKIAYGRERAPERFEKYAVRIGTDRGVKIHAGLARLLDNAGFSSVTATKKFLKWVDSYKPDLVHLHNIHGYYLHVGLLFAYLKAKNIPVVWSLHDCWAFTGHCSHFDSVGCQKWETGCYACVNKKSYPASVFLDNSRRNYKRKKHAFTCVKNMSLVVPSNWLAQTVERSYLREYPLYQIPMGIDLQAFKPTESDFRTRYGLENKKIVLGVATAWSKQKGIDDFVALSKTLGEGYKIVLVGVDNERAQTLPETILCLPRTNSVEELAQIYSSADVFFNPSVEETMGLTTVEALACGTPAIVYNKTAVPEIVDGKSGVVLPCRIDGFEEAYQKAVALDKEDILARARLYEKWAQYQKYLQVYEDCIKGE